MLCLAQAQVKSSGQEETPCGQQLERARVGPSGVGASPPPRRDGARATLLHLVESGLLRSGRLRDAGNRQTFFNFQRPRRNSTAAITASIEKAVVIARKTPRGPKPV